jgi:hypothetical protein
MREEHEFDKLWCNLDRESEQKRHQDAHQEMMLQKKKECQSRRRETKKEQRSYAALDNEFDGLKIEDDVRSFSGRRSRRSRALPDSSTFDPAGSLSGLSVDDDCRSGVPGISGTALGLILVMHEPSRSSVKESRMASKKRRPAITLKAKSRSSSFNDKSALYRTLQSPDYS